ncbi:O-antigen ligase family protein [Streptococcus suis]|uniref:O-antigen ligase family protein n=1 Tax=Streptococcus suis TaxID=1307 RepID=UPI000CF67A7D|nr:O-antigen ligase family protein [Streptococcus suis]
MQRLKITISPLGLLYVAMITLALFHQSGLFSFYYLTSILVSLFWLIMGMLSYLITKKRTKSELYAIEKKVASYLLIPWIAMIIYNVILYSTGNGAEQFIKSSFVQIMFAPIIIGGAAGSYIIFGNKVIEYTKYAILIYYITAIPIMLYNLGVANFINGVLSPFTGSLVTNPFEQNSDLVLSLGILVIYYFDYSKGMKKSLWLLPLMLLILGGKRIMLLSLLILCGIKIYSSMMSIKNKVRLQYFLSFVLLVAMFIFVYLIKSSIFSNYVYSHGINTMGRVKMWDYVAQYVEFSPSYLGYGYAFSNLLLEQNRVLTFGNKVYVLHSDILKIYYDLGFWIFTYWGIYNLFRLPHKIGKNYNLKIENTVWLLTIYLFLLYFTDNALTYFTVQTLYTYTVIDTIRKYNREYN